jgi:hypothetical protein
MGRLDNKKGRFHADFETTEINRALLGWQQETGDTVLWYRFSPEDSVTHDIYDEATFEGKVFDGPYQIDVLHVTHQEGSNKDTDTGFYTNDDLHITASYNQLVDEGFVHPDLFPAGYLKDRIVYDQKVFRILRLETLGQIHQRDIIIGLDATQVKPDELVNDLQFAQYAAVAQPKPPYLGKVYP